MAKERRDPLEPVEGTLDRLQEAHWYLYEMEVHYHRASPFRWSYNSFLRATKEVPDLLQMHLQNRDGFKEWFAPYKSAIRGDALLSYLSKQRDVVVHQRMILPQSHAALGLTEGRGMKFGIGHEMDPRQDSDVLMMRYLIVCARDRDGFGLLEEDDDSLPAVERKWGISPFPGEEMIDLAAKAWQVLASTLDDTAEWLGSERIHFNLDCRHSAGSVRVRAWEREVLSRIVSALKKGSHPDKLMPELAVHGFSVS